MTTHMYQVTGMHCNGCVQSVKISLKQVPGVTGVQVQLADPQVILGMENEVSLEELQASVSAAGNYTITAIEEAPADAPVKKTAFESILGLFHRKKACCR